MAPVAQGCRGARGQADVHPGQRGPPAQAGRPLVYATCSILPQENEAIAEAFSAAHPDFQLLDASELLEQLKVEGAKGLCSGGASGSSYLRLWPHLHQTDGFFAAIWAKKD